MEMEEHERSCSVPTTTRADRGQGVKQAARDALEVYGTALTGSRFMNGTTPLHVSWSERSPVGCGPRMRSSSPPATRQTSAAWARSGGRRHRDLRLGNHASILDGCRLSGAKLRPFRHNRMEKLEKMLQRAGEDGGGVLVVVDGVFSMEGDICEYPHRGALRAFGARLMVDEAHGAGVLGARGAGACELFGLEDG